MSKLTDAQLVILSKAAQREDRVVDQPTRPNSKTIAMIKTLIERGLIAEIAADPAMPVWRYEDARNEPLALVITDLGLVAIGVSTEPTVEEPQAAKKRIKPTAKRKAAPKAANAKRQKDARPPPSAPATGKTALVFKLLQRKEGASITALTQATGWLPHSVRAVLTGLRKKGYGVSRDKAKDKTKTIYRIVKVPADKAA